MSDKIREDRDAGKHTPGPWALTAEGLGFSVRSAGTKKNGYSSEHICSMDHYRDDRKKTQVPNACLIAAAPDMLKALPRAAEMLRISAEFIRAHAAEFTAFYDDAECDGYCIADDCEAAAETLEIAIARATGDAQ